MSDTGRWARLNEALDLAQKPLREDFEWLVGEYERLRVALAAHDQDHRVLWTGPAEQLFDPLALGLSAGTVVAVVSRDNQNDATEEQR